MPRSCPSGASIPVSHCAANPPTPDDVDAAREKLKDMDARSLIVYWKLEAAQRAVAVKYKLKLR